MNATPAQVEILKALRAGATLSAHLGARYTLAARDGTRTQPNASTVAGLVSKRLIQGQHAWPTTIYRLTLAGARLTR